MKALIDLDWIDSEIDDLLQKGSNSKSDYIRLFTLAIVRSKCEPIDVPIINYDLKDSATEPVFQHDVIDYNHIGIGSIYELPAKCLLDWKSAKYCHNENQCLMCKTK